MTPIDVLCANFLNLANRKLVKSPVAYLTITNEISPGCPAVATARIAPKICQDEPPRMCSECSRFHPNHFTFGGVIAERVNTAKMYRKVNQTFGRSLASIEPNNNEMMNVVIYSYHSVKYLIIMFRTAKQKADGAETSSKRASFHQLWTISAGG